MNEQNQHAVTVHQPEVIDVPAQDTRSAALILNGDAMERAFRFAEVMASGKATVPDHIRNTGDCLAITIQAMQWGMNPFAVAQKTHLVGKTLGYEAQLVNAVIASRAPVTGRINYDWFGDWDKIAGKFKEIPAKNNPDEKRIVRDWTVKEEEGLGVKVWATFKGEDSPRELRLLLSQAGVRNSPLWGQDPKQQLAYLAVKRWARLYCPDVILGVYTPDEIEDETSLSRAQPGRAEVIRNEPEPASEAFLKKAHSAAGKGVEAFREYYKSVPRNDRYKLAPHMVDLRQASEDAEKKRAPKPDEAAPTGDAPDVTPKIVEDCLNAAFEGGDIDELHTAADMIRQVNGEAHQEVLTKLYHDLRSKMEG
ncbi:RecT family recombinase [Robbsia andropogonis]|uniref:RecT family recombinase n=1 Tax=Robbsia andropogonis TaxID=28092 RepID=UPI003D24AE42